ncbi:MAG TPA: penicillin acylase family protein, partial [Cyclobacteriaceae bacterium]|nr:penicillin acylase family protein [Cyclobacteriaceae bacterium]
MKNHRSLIFFMLLFSFSSILHAQKLAVPGLLQEVEVFRDPFGINHIYALNEHDLFFAQGYLAARDRTFQFEIWRRQATGTVAEILGERELKRDIGARLFRFRGDKEKELNHYHPRGVKIVDAYVEGINAFIDETANDPSLLSPEFALLDIRPQHWTWEDVISRHQGLLGNINKELEVARMVSLLGEEKVKELYYFHPFDPELTIHPSVPKDLLFKDILELYNAFRTSIKFEPGDVLPSASNANAAGEHDSSSEMLAKAPDLNFESPDLGS